ncbi:peptidoglycan-associated lipoprotein Pal [Shewanella loihica]|uniref:Peptidoglycan-associated lipoprotein n=2 Tax=Shewanella TaxID=22 RepID=A3QD47_SHELP|nr:MULTISPECIES: peptidoglycan-associated lipoprotein Pal [Shewanella]ABO23395.1 OmpA domain protein [Shewanella loihica PV-4]MCG9711615.1 peptidoglycan-associated lipoprotein Pal [Shewanella insulae]MCG9737413.1 peptidoglycan-associated lipoprotein Pal [Shewanella insulae]MCG9746049.1 peptidoglycan-associated lipoprotein Pal [Shewanella sp. Isolate8]MCG9755103.1 peptidoglycan-associated lipoprotein Pal [Shewanella insulae]
MDLNKLFKAMVVALPIMAISACSSTSESQTDATSSMSGSESSEMNAGGGVETGGVAPILTPEEQQRIKYQELRKEHIIYFDFDRSSVSSDFSEVLNAHGEYLLEHPNVRVMIEGHADERGTPEYNIALGERRAKAVAKYLQSMGVLPSQMSIVSYGEEKPQDFSRTDDGFAKNRRAVLVY